MRLPSLTLILAATGLVCGRKQEPSNVESEELNGVVERTIPIRQHTFYAPYVDSDLQNRWFDFGGDTIVDTNKHIRLTQDRGKESGWLWSRTPLGINQFEIEFEFSVDGKGNSVYGDGFALWLTTDRATPGPVFGNQDYWQGVGIFFDTYANSRHTYTFPIISLFQNDGSYSYDVNKDGANRELARCSLDFRRTPVQAKGKLTYVKNQFLRLEVQHTEWDQWTQCFLVNNVNLPNSPYLGFSAHTGDVSDNHDIVSLSTYSVVYHPLTKEQMAARVGRPPRSSVASFFTSLFSIIFTLGKWLTIIGFFIALGVFGWQWKVKRDAKRF